MLVGELVGKWINVLCEDGNGPGTPTDTLTGRVLEAHVLDCGHDQALVEVTKFNGVTYTGWPWCVAQREGDKWKFIGQAEKPLPKRETIQ